VIAEVDEEPAWQRQHEAMQLELAVRGLEHEHVADGDRPGVDPDLLTPPERGQHGVPGTCHQQPLGERGELAPEVVVLRQDWFGELGLQRRGAFAHDSASVSNTSSETTAGRS